MSRKTAKQRQAARRFAATNPCGDPHAREPNGKPSRKVVDREARKAMTEQEAKSVVVAARIRQGVDPAYADLSDAGRPNAGTIHGRMRLSGALSADQWQAAEWFIGTRSAYLRAILAKGEGLQSEGPSHGTVDSGAYEEWCRNVIDLWAAVTACLQEATNLVRRPVISALDVMLTRNQYVEHMEGDLRVGLNVIHKQFLADRRRAA